MNKTLKKALVLAGGAASLLGLASLAIAQVSGIGSVAATATSNLPNVAKLITAGSYVAGFGFAVAAIVKFKAHKENPTQVQISQPIALVFVAAALIFIPNVFSAGGGTLFGEKVSQAGVAGITGFTDAGKK